MEERAHDALSQGELYNQGGNFTGPGERVRTRPTGASGARPKALLAIEDRAEFAGMGEETLRSHFLVQRNGVYEGQATGETFNFEGNTVS